MNDSTSLAFVGNGAISIQVEGPDPRDDEVDLSSFGACIRALRKRAGLSLTEMAGRVGLSVSHYHRIELDKKAPLASPRWEPLLAVGADMSTLVALANQSRTRRRAQRRPRCHAGRVTIAPGVPGSATWDEQSWEDDDACWYAVTCHPDGLTVEQIAALTGYSAERVRQIEVEALAKLATEPEAVEGMEAIDDRDNQLAVWSVACEDEMFRQLEAASLDDCLPES